MKIRFSRRLLRGIALIGGIGVLVLGSGCDDPAGIKAGAEKAAAALQSLTDSINHAADAAERQSEGWQKLVTDLQAKTMRDLDEQRRKVFEENIPRIVAGVGVQGRCTADFAGKRVAQHLRRLANALNGKQTQPFMPTVCMAVPNSIDAGLVPAQQKTLQWDGYDFLEKSPDSEPLRAALVRHDESREFHKIISKTSDYVVVADLTRLPNPIPDAFVRLALVWNGTNFGEVPVVRRTPTPPTPPPSKQIFNVNIKTYKKDGAGTDATVFLVLIGTKGRSHVFTFPDNDKKTLFEPGLTDPFTVTNDYIGEIRQIEIGHKNDGGESSPWNLERVDVVDVATNFKAVFSCPRTMWFSRNREDRIQQQLARTLDADK